MRSAVFKAADVVASFHRAAAAHGYPASLLTDNGAVFTAVPRGGRCAIELETARLGIRSMHSRPYHPQTCGKVERVPPDAQDGSSRAKTTPRRFPISRHSSTASAPTTTRSGRIGRSDGRTPAEAFDARPKATPSLERLAVPDRLRLRRDKVDITGVVTLRRNSRLHHIGLGRKLIGTRVLVLVDDLHVRVITEDGELLRDLIVDPTRDYQPHGRR